MILALNRMVGNDGKDIKLAFFILATFWTIVLGCSLWFNIDNTYKHNEEAARIQARTAFEKDVIYRSWNSSLNGVYAPITSTTLPNPYLPLNGRDVTTTDGLRLTKINPAYMTRLVHEMGELSSGVRGHITSNLPIRSGNTPTEWESEALKILESGGRKEVSEVSMLDGEEYMLFIKPLMVEESCMSCHAFQGYKVGEVRGGISVSVPMAQIRAAAENVLNILIVSHILIWALGMGLFLLSTRRILKHEIERDQAEEKLFQLNLQLEERVQEGIAEVKKKHMALQGFMDFTEALVYLKDTKSHYTMANKNYEFVSKPYEQLQGKTDEEAGLNCNKIFDKIHIYENQAITTQQAVHPEEVFSFDDSDKVYAAAIFPVLDSNKQVEGIGAMFFDITQRIRLEESMRIAKDEAESANRAKSDFLANVSHEIRTPLNGVIGMADLLQRTKLTRDQISMLATIKSGGDSLLSVLNDVLDFSKIEAGKIYLENAPFSLHDVAFDTVKCLAHIAHKKCLELIVHIAPQVPEHLLGDAIRIRQVLLNLFSNAIKFTEEGEITLTIKVLQQEGDNVSLRISVTDTGIGILPEKQKAIFSAFEQADNSTTRKYGGTGLGLAISSRLVELMESTLLLESQPDLGSTFWFDLSLPLTNQHSSFKHLMSNEFLNGFSVLAVDDNLTNLRILSEQLKSWDMKVEQATNVDEAMQLLNVAMNRQQDFALVLTDLQMPKKDGFDLINEMQANPLLCEIPIIMLSSGDIRANTQVPKTLMSNLTKPVRPDDLMRAVTAALGVWECFHVSSIEQIPEEYEQITSSISLKVLLVDDMEINQIVASTMLQSLGHMVILAENGQQALNLISEEDFDIVFMDIQMPVMDGEQATKIIRENETSNPLLIHMPIVAMTAHAMKGDKEKYIAAGMDSYVSKPVKLERLVEVIDEMVKSFNLINRK